MRRADHDVAHCCRCGRERQTHPSRQTNPLCVDCKTVERGISDGEAFTGLYCRDRRGIVHMQPKVARMSPADRAWCERAAAAHFWHAWERANRTTGPTPAMVTEAQRRTRKAA